MKRLIGYRKKIVSLMCAVMIVSIGILSTFFSSEAVGTSNSTVFSVNYPEPDTSDFSGYISIIYQVDGTEQYLLNTYFWTITPYDTTSSVTFSMGIEISSRNVKFVPYVSSSLYDWSLAEYGSTDNLTIHKHGVYKKTDNDYYSYTNNFRTIKGYIFGGNVNGVISSLSTTITPEIHWSDSLDASYVYSYLQLIFAHLEQIDGDTSDVWEELVRIYNQNVSMNQKLEDLKELYEQLIDEQEKSNTWLGKIWDSIQEFVNPSDNDSQKTDQFNNEANTQKSEIDDLNEQNQVNKVDVNSATAQVDANIDYDNMAQYGGVLATITNNSYVLQMILIVVSIGIIAYVLFGKR